jgi:methylenetetrahydrofolate dehydrogenase (NADP+)/methenyltetrahydrofolate cyclohydrolase
MATVIDGKSIAAQLRAQVATEVADLNKKRGIKPGLAVILVGDDPASSIYVKNKGAMTKEAGMESFDFRMPANVKESELLAKIHALNLEPKVNGILVQLPLPKHINENAVISAIDPLKDVDGFHPMNVGLLSTGQSGMVPCTPLGCLRFIKGALGDSLPGKHAVIVGRSNIVGKPMAALLLKESCTVTVAHSHTKHLPELCRTADILVAAVGKPEMIKGEWIKDRATVIDVGINRIQLSDGSFKLVGDVAYAEALQRARFITPVPGGVGPMTIACLLLNTLKATYLQHKIEPEFIYDSYTHIPSTDD